jgi:hypothetical protein
MDNWHAIGSDVIDLDRGQWAVVVGVIWLGVAYGSLVLLGSYTVELYFTVSLIGFLIVGFLFAPPQTNPRWWGRFRWLMILALTVFGYLVYQRVVTVLQG